MDEALLYKDKPLFALDIGYKSLKVMQIHKGKKSKVVGYGVIGFDPTAIVDGVIVKPDVLAQTLQELIKNSLVGKLTTRRIALTIPASHTYSHATQLPKLNTKDLKEAVHREAEQYIPHAIDELYIDYEVTHRNDDQIDVLLVASPKKLIDSYILFARMAGLEVAAIEPTINAGCRLFVRSSDPGMIPPSILIDLGSLSSDLTIYDKNIIVTGTANGGGDNFTENIAKVLGVSHEEAHVIKVKYGLGVSKKQKLILEAASPVLDSLMKEIRRMIRYYEEHTPEKHSIGQIITFGGGSNMPGVAEYMTDKLRLPVRPCHPWDYLHFGRLQPPSEAERSMYLTVAGLALIEPGEIFA
jgi:type IV pilus assembly protein PilM